MPDIKGIEPGGSFSCLITSCSHSLLRTGQMSRIKFAQWAWLHIPQTKTPKGSLFYVQRIRYFLDSNNIAWHLVKKSNGWFWEQILRFNFNPSQSAVHRKALFFQAYMRKVQRKVANAVQNLDFDIRKVESNETVAISKHYKLPRGMV